MSAATNMNTYLNNHYQGKTPEQLIQMLYQGALRNLSLAKQGIDENNPRKRGEHLGKAIAIITELYTSLDTEIKDEPIQFLRELYSNMLTELPKVSLNNDSKAIDLTYSYIKQLNHIWETEVLNKEGSTGEYAGNIDKTDNSSPPKSLFA
ncbi:MAG: flagellar export chaperone FliS [Desulfobacteraceae bacterium]|nr:flagellar export chaperone FliS [Desulfobacteraceae bacterium]